MRIVVFTMAGSDKRIHVDANRVEAVAESHAGNAVTEIHAWGGGVFMVKGTVETVMKTLWGSANTLGEEAVPFSPEAG